MSEKTGIQWTDRTWNPVRGCSRISEGCRNCYAERVAARFSTGKKLNEDPPVRIDGPFTGFAKLTPSGPHWTGKVELIESKLTEPLHWRKPSRVFANSMSDLFHEGLDFITIDRVVAIMALCEDQTFQVLTKRASRLPEYFTEDSRVRINRQIELWWEQSPEMFPAGRSFPRFTQDWPLPNVWLGVSVEERKNKDRIDILRDVPAAVRFLSLEPQLEDLGELDLRGIDWIIVGGESGPGARPFDIEWARQTVQQCKAAGVACFVKQLGANPYEVPDDPPAIAGEVIGNRFALELLDRKGGDMAEWPEDLRVREFPEVTR